MDRWMAKGVDEDTAIKRGFHKAKSLRLRLQKVLFLNYLFQTLVLFFWLC